MIWALLYYTYKYYKTSWADFLLIHYQSGWPGRRAAGGIETKANSAQLSWDWGWAWQKLIILREHIDAKILSFLVSFHNFLHTCKFHNPRKIPFRRIITRRLYSVSIYFVSVLWILYSKLLTYWTLQYTIKLSSMKHKIIDSQFPCKILVKLGLLLCIHFSQNTIIWMNSLHKIFNLTEKWLCQSWEK